MIFCWWRLLPHEFRFYFQPSRLENGIVSFIISQEEYAARQCAA
jgi:hypothetical protein